MYSTKYVKNTYVVYFITVCWTTECYLKQKTILVKTIKELHTDERSSNSEYTFIYLNLKKNLFFLVKDQTSHLFLN